ncbi:putative pentatricopeptide repeat-containing protein At5g37570 [Chenopodium quinoa]|nr:putative pentatricopeptide repeat-containing protein At5g37570 [Chenopodium quinoa]
MKHQLPASSPPIITLLKSCNTLRCFQQIHVQIIRKGLEHDNYLISNFVSRCCSSFSLLQYATTVFNSVSCANTCLWNSLLKGHCNYSSLSSSLSVFSAMRASSEGAPDKYTFPPLMKCCANELDAFVGVGIHGLLIKYGVEDDVFVGSSLVDLYGKCRLIRDAQKVFDEMSVRNVVSWTSLLVGYVNSEDLVNARRVFDVMPKRNQVSWNAMISGYVKLGQLDSARKLFDELPFKNVVSYTMMIDGYAKCGDMSSANFFFEQCSVKDLVLWSALISGYAQNGLPYEAVKSFLEMKLSNTRPDEHIMVSVMSACAQVGNMKLANEIDSYMNRSSFDLQRTHVVAALVDMNAKCGNMERARSLFDNMPKRDLVSYCSMIQGHALHGQGAEAVKLFYNMLSEGITPDDVAFTVILTACSHAALVEEGYCLFDMMSKYSITPSPDHYACMIDLLGRSGHLEAAYDLLKSLPIEAHAECWGALLGACRLHCDTELAEVVANRLVELEPHNAGNFVLLSNVYAAVDRWLDVSNVRNQMVDRGLNKILGRSWV